VNDIFRHDRTTGETIRVSVDSAGAQADKASFNHAISANGRYIAFQSDATNLVAGDTNLSYDIFVRDTVLNKTVRVSVDANGGQAVGANPVAPGNADSTSPSISDDGRYVSFTSLATNLVPGDTNAARDIFVVDGGQAHGWWFA
jgi:dipeptidyl aminopeptidase/acylaminoacyl peptidase